MHDSASSLKAISRDQQKPAYSFTLAQSASHLGPNPFDLLENNAHLVHAQQDCRGQDVSQRRVVVCGYDLSHLAEGLAIVLCALLNGLRIAASLSVIDVREGQDRLMQQTALIDIFVHGWKAVQPRQAGTGSTSLPSGPIIEEAS